MTEDRDAEIPRSRRHRVKLQEGMSAPIDKRGMSAKGEQPAKPSPPPKPADSAASAKPKK